VATGVITLAGVFMASSYVPDIFWSASWLLLFMVPAYVVSFVGHELIHKFVAHANGLWAEFRTSSYGLLMTLVTAVLPVPFKILAPGQTSIRGEARSEVLGTVALSGPAFNLVLGFFSLLSSRAISNTWLDFICFQVTMFNCWIAIFNLIPFGSFDGTAVFAWDKTRWAIIFSTSLALIVAAYYIR